MKYFPTTARIPQEYSTDRNAFSPPQSSVADLRPVAPDEASHEQPNQQDSVNIRNKILVVDDDAGVREVLASLLRRSGYRVSCANNGEAGWEALCAESFDALITDHAMPRLTGLDLLRRVRTGTLHALPVILISGKMPWEEPDLLDLVWPGLAMEKPFSFFEMLTSVRTVLTMTLRAESLYDGQPLSVFDHKLPPPAVAVWQDDGRTRLPVRKLVRAK